MSIQMMQHTKLIGSWLISLLAMLLLTGCGEDITAEGTDDILAGDAVQFTTYVQTPVTRATSQDELTAEMNSNYKIIESGYKLSVSMLQKLTGVSEGEVDTSIVATGTYTSTNNANGILSGSSLYWPDTQNRYGFKAEAGSDVIEADQSQYTEGYLQQDKLLGFGYLPLYYSDPSQMDQVDAANYHTAKDWKAGIKSYNNITDNSDATKRIPLYMKHQRAKITVILKAADDFPVEDLQYNQYPSALSATIYSYTEGKDEADVEISPYTYEYTWPEGLEHAGDKTTAFTAVVNPYDYATHSSKVIIRIVIANQKFTFMAANEANTENSSAYNLTAGKHLIITATLSRDQRKVAFTANVQDWESEPAVEANTDEFGGNGNTMQIVDKATLIEFLTSTTEYNTAGGVGVVAAESIDLDEDWDGSKYRLNGTLNLAGATILTKHQMLDTIASTGKLVNGTISVKAGSSLPSAVASINSGTIDKLDVVADKTSRIAQATVAGLVEKNDQGTISNCTSDLPVYGVLPDQASEAYVGGIAGTSLSATVGGITTRAIIDNCTVNARIDGAKGVKGGGIVGSADGKVTNCTNDYGITLLQDADNFKNIVQHAATENTEFTGNAWPTIAENRLSSVNVDNAVAESDRYTAVIDRQAELKESFTSSYNAANCKYRLADSFELKDWNHYNSTNGYESTADTIHTKYNDYSANYLLEGNHKTITTDGMIFNTISNAISNLQVKLSANLIATPHTTSGIQDGLDGYAPVAFAVAGSNAVLSNVNVTSDYYVQSANPSGVVVWAYDGATIQNCKSNVPVQVWLASSVVKDANHFAGGIVASAYDASIMSCSYSRADNTLFVNTSADYTSTSTTGASTGVAYYGGILGGPSEKRPSATGTILIQDCASNFSTPTTTNAYKGSILGTGVYSGNTYISADCSGNWWPALSYPVGTGGASLVGTKNAVTPSFE